MPKDPKSEPTFMRGARSFLAHRFETVEREVFDDGWTPEEKEQDGETRPLPTQVTIERARTIVSHNDSPDVGFDSSINPYRGCEHGCIYCVRGDTPILMADGSTKPIAETRVGDAIYGTRREGRYRRYVKQRVLAHWSVVKPAYRLALEDGTELVAGGDHRFLTERGWKFVTEGPAQRPFLTTNNKLMGTGAFAQSVAQDDDYERGYLCGVIRGDGHLASYDYDRPRRTADQHQFRLALCDVEALIRAQEYLRRWEVNAGHFVFQAASANRRLMHAIRTHARLDVEQIRRIVAWPAEAGREWNAGFLAGIYDAEGSYSDGILRISNTDRQIIDRITQGLRLFGFGFAVEHVHREPTKPIDVVRVLGGLREHLRFFHLFDPAIARKRDISGQAVKSAAKLGVAKIEALGRAMRLYDITTETEDFIANGVVSHNCYARPSHSYLELSPGLDFETKLFAKTNAAELLREELSKPGYRPSPIALGANTDCYQPIERKYRITRSIIEVLSETNHPLSIVTKSALVERDLDLLGPMAAKNLVRVYVSIGSLDRELARKLEPRAASPQRRLDVLKALKNAGVPCGVMVAALIPALNDATMEHVLEAAAAAGAEEAAYVIMRLPNELKDLFKEWLAAHYPQRAAHVMSVVHQMRGGRDNDPRFGTRMSGTGNFAELVAKRFEIACRKHGLNEHGAGRRRAELDCTLFRPPGDGRQIALF
jgi:DNA repair photolyase